MAKLINCDMEYFLEYIKTKQIIAFGAGGKFLQFISDHSLERKIEFVVDNDINKQGTGIIVNDVFIKVENIRKLLEYKKAEFIILITGFYSIAQMLEQINSYAEFDQIECFSVCLMQDHCQQETISYTIGEPIIPKVIHYCWFGGNPIPDKLLNCMETWKKFCPDYEIVRWDESNYDVHKNVYMSQAYECGKWGFVPDYARLDIVGNYGGIYFDTDVELVKSLDDLLMDKSFFGFFNYDYIAPGLGFGSIAGNKLLQQLRDDYNDRRFIKEDGSMDLRACSHYQTRVLKEYGFIMNNKQQAINGNVLYPMEVFNPLGGLDVFELYTNNTHSIHRATISWGNDKNVQDWSRGKIILKQMIGLEK